MEGGIEGLVRHHVDPQAEEPGCLDAEPDQPSPDTARVVDAHEQVQVAVGTRVSSGVGTEDADISDAVPGSQVPQFRESGRIERVWWATDHDGSDSTGSGAPRGAAAPRAEPRSEGPRDS